MKVPTSLFIVMLLGCTHSYSQNSVSLPEAISIAQQIALPQQQANIRFLMADLDRTRTEASFKPRLALQGVLPDFTRSFEEIQQPDGSVLFQPVRYNNSYLALGLDQVLASTGGSVFVTSDIQRFDNFNKDESWYRGLPIRVGLRQPLFAFNPHKWRRQLAPLRFEAATKQFTAEMEGIALQTTSLYFDILVAQTDYQIALTNRNNNDTLYHIAQERFRLGELSRNDLLQLKRESLQASREELSARQSLSAARQRLAAFLKIDTVGQVEIPAAPKLSQIDRRLALSYAQKNRPELADFRRLAMEAERDADQARKEAGFTANLDASFGFARGADNISDIYTDPQQELKAQLGFSVPLVDWGRGKQLVRQRELIVELTKAEIDQFERELAVEVNLLGQSYESLRSELEVAQELNEIAQERFRISKDRYLYGDISITDLTLSLREKDQAQRDFVLVQRALWSTYYDLRATTLYDFFENREITYLVPSQAGTELN